MVQVSLHIVCRRQDGARHKETSALATATRNCVTTLATFSYAFEPVPAMTGHRRSGGRKQNPS